MNKSDIIDKLSEKHPSLSKRQINLLTGSLFNKLATSLATGQRIEIRGFGTFSLKRRNPGKVRNVKRGIFIEVGVRHNVSFRPGKQLAQLVNVQNN